MVIQTHPQASIPTIVIDSKGQTRSAIVTSKQYLFSRLRDFKWHNVNEFTGKISSSGFRGRLSELRSSGYGFETEYNSNGTATRIRLVALPGVGTFRATA